jgi:hypothetical protein
MHDIKKQFKGSFEGRITVSPSDGVTPQIVLTASNEVIEYMDNILFSKGIIGLKEPTDKNHSVLRFDLKNNTSK